MSVAIIVGLVVLAVWIYGSGHSSGHREGKRIGSRKGYGVGFARGRSQQGSGCLLMIVAGLSVLSVLAWLIG